jgi:hypothetical protein
LRKGAGRWRAEETVAMFMELYERVLGVDDSKAVLVRQRLLAYARQQIRHLPGENKPDRASTASSSAAESPLFRKRRM